MGFFDLFKSKQKKQPQNNPQHQFLNQLFPKGKQDLNFACKRLNEFLKQPLPQQQLQQLLIRSYSMSEISKEFTLTRFKQHLDGYATQLFTKEGFLNCWLMYLTFREARRKDNLSPSDVGKKITSWQNKYTQPFLQREARLAQQGKLNADVLQYLQS